jgi:hypothetical protein
MSTSFKNPKLLLLKGVLGHYDAGLSSINALGEVLFSPYYSIDPPGATDLVGGYLTAATFLAPFLQNGFDLTRSAY